MWALLSFGEEINWHYSMAAFTKVGEITRCIKIKHTSAGRDACVETAFALRNELGSHAYSPEQALRSNFILGFTLCDLLIRVPEVQRAPFTCLYIGHLPAHFGASYLPYSLHKPLFDKLAAGDSDFVSLS